MFVAFARCDLIVPGSESLKDKRRVVRHLVDGIRVKFNVAVAEVDHMDLRQRSAIGVACVSNSFQHSREVIDAIDRFIRSHPELEVLSMHVQVVTPEDA